MRFSYAYKTSDGVRHEDLLNAESREAVFAELRAKGIRPIKVVAADGSKANGEIRGVRKRVLVLSLVAVAILAVTVTAIFFSMVNGKDDSVRGLQTDQTRRQIIGDIAIVEKGIVTGWSDVFADEGDRFLASFAIPGVKAGQRNTSVAEIEKALARRIDATDGDSLEARQIKAMVEGMKAEARAYLAAGGTIVSYGQRLTERQDAEIAIFERAKTDVENAREKMSDEEFLIYWEKQNDQLRNLGIKLIPLEQ